MPRLRLLRDDELTPAMRAMLPGKEENVRIFGHRPETYLRWLQFYNPLRTTPLIEPRTRELVRLKIAALNDCAYCLAYRATDALQDGLDEATICQLADYEQSAGLSPREKAAVRFAEYLAIHHHAIDQPFIDDLRGYFTDAEIVELGWLIVSFLAAGRLTRVFDIRPTRDVSQGGGLVLPEEAIQPALDDGHS